MTEVITSETTPAVDPGSTGPAASPGLPAPTSAVPGTSLVTLLARRVVPMALVLGVLAVLTKLAAQPLGNSDTYFHLRFGHEFLDGSWSLRHPGSVTALGTADWVPTQWLPQVVMAQLEDWFGLPGVAWFSGLQFVALATATYLVGRRWADPVVAAPVTMFVVIGSASGLSMRPQVMSYVLVVLTVAAWLAARESLRAPWLLVPMTWVWASYHGMWPVGLTIGVAACVGLGLDRRVTGRRLLVFAAVPTASALAAALTPVGPRLYGAVLTVNERGQYFSEWGPPQFTSPNCIAVLVLLGTAALVMVRAGRTSWTDAALLALAAGWAVYSSRTVPVAAALATPVVATALQSLLGTRRRPDRAERLVVWGGAVGALVVLALLVPTTAAEPLPQPRWVDPVLSALPAGTRIINDSGYGGYLMWAYPQLDVVLSGYGDIYTDRELEDHATIEDAGPGWVDLVRATGARVALLSSDSTLAYNLRLQGWDVVHESRDVDQLVAPAGW